MNVEPLASVPPHVPAELVVDFDIFNPTSGGEDIYDRWRSLQSGIGTFGFGAHRCPGSFLARTELRIFLEVWLPRIPEFDLTPGDRPEYAGGMGVSITRLPLSWPIGESTPARRVATGREV